jgi:FkbM family methyltransferase
MYSQFGEDEEIAKLWPLDFKGYAADVGAANGVNRNNTILLENLGWTVLCVEANPLYKEILELKRKLSRNVACGSKEGEGEFTAYELDPGVWEACSALKPVGAMVELHRPLIKGTYKFTVPIKTLDSLLEEVKFPHLDFLSLDVEGAELDVLAGFNLQRWQPTVICIENWDEKSKDQADILVPAGYEFWKRFGVNDVYKRA